MQICLIIVLSVKGGNRNVLSEEIVEYRGESSCIRTDAGQDQIRIRTAQLHTLTFFSPQLILLRKVKLGSELVEFFNVAVR